MKTVRPEMRERFSAWPWLARQAAVIRPQVVNASTRSPTAARHEAGGVVVRRRELLRDGGVARHRTAVATAAETACRGPAPRSGCRARSTTRRRPAAPSRRASPDRTPHRRCCQPRPRSSSRGGPEGPAHRHERLVHLAVRRFPGAVRRQVRGRGGAGPRLVQPGHPPAQVHDHVGQLGLDGGASEATTSRARSRSTA